jgi:branched-chain amino acid transport system ATP-binding protein
VTAAVELIDVRKSFGATPIIRGVSLALEAGTRQALIGPNGAGKSTVFKAVFGLLPVQRGRVVFDGRDISGLGPARLLQLGIVYVPQGRNVFPELSVAHNLELGTTDPRPARVAALMERFPMLREKAHAQASTLSGGQQKLLEIARGLLLEPKLMLIDEPSIGLSPLLVREIFDILGDLRAKGVTILMVEQNAKRALEISDFGVVLELGRTRMEGKARELLADPRVGQLFLGGATL